MKKLALAAALLTFCSGTAIAADVTLKSAAPPITVPTWVGFYLGAHGGYGWNDDSFSQVQAVGIFNDVVGVINGIKSNGWVGGGHAGYNWQNGYVVSGFEGDLSALGIKGANSVAGTLGGGAPVTVTVSTNLKYVGTARARLGFATDSLGSSFMFYGTAGAAWERLDETSTLRSGADVIANTTPTNLFGWVAGLGTEARVLGSSWTARVEYLHYDFGSAHTGTTIVAASPPVNAASRGGSQTLDVVRAGLSYAFGAGSLARY